MRTITLKGTSVVTSAVGFGCVSLTMHDNRRRAIALLEQALDLGVTHYDVAPLYGFGQAEGILGEFLRGKRDRVTVATKFGLEPPVGLSKRRRLVSALRWVSHRVPLAAWLARKTVGRGAVKEASFTTADAARSLEKSLRELGTDYVDVFLLHEGTLSQASRPELLDWLDAQVKKGTIRSFGLATNFGNLPADPSLVPRTHSVLQFNSSVLVPNVSKLTSASDRGLITFGALEGAARLAGLAAMDIGLASRYRDRLGEDLAQVGSVAGIMLRAALEQNPEGIVLFATTKIEHLRGNVRFAERVLTSDELRAFHEFASEAGRPLEVGRD